MRAAVKLMDNLWHDPKSVLRFLTVSKLYIVPKVGKLTQLTALELDGLFD
jgi:hypothetical protein